VGDALLHRTFIDHLATCRVGLVRQAVSAGQPTKQADGPKELPPLPAGADPDDYEWVEEGEVGVAEEAAVA
jgi:hypothetical protein